MPNASYRVVDQSDRVRALCRAWAADVRDLRRPYHGVSTETRRLAGFLCTALDSWETVRRFSRRPDAPKNLESEAKLTVHQLIERLEKTGVSRPPS